MSDNKEIPSEPLIQDFCSNVSSYSPAPTSTLMGLSRVSSKGSLATKSLSLMRVPLVLSKSTKKTFPDASILICTTKIKAVMSVHKSKNNLKRKRQQVVTSPCDVESSQSLANGKRERPRLEAPQPQSIMADARQKNVVVSKPILYGSVATYLGRKAEETKTHRWSIYLRGVDNEDLSYMISKVVISLHVSFANPVRVLTEPPYEVTELGWGEFETRIQIYFHDPTERPISIIHLLVFEFYDELVFNEPTEFFYKKLMAGPDRQAPPLAMQDHLPTYSDVEVLKTLARAETFVKKEIQDTKNLLLSTDMEIKELKERIAEHTKKKKQADKTAAAHTTAALPMA
ncbi:unnamed protein product [Phytophthora fragariaefolia]|uniref:Unnamed protein product n=1 Tax=Phytophthora fragariaefolia TaxID=1490495 RepID=A0A9W6XXN0_9STRA|nr:unnamed protein product [Phytophthora fragariaefolia]